LEIREIYEQHGTTLFRRAYAWLGDRASAEDAVHSVFTRLVDRGCDGVRDIEAYLHRALSHELARSASRQRHESLAAAEFVVAREVGDSAETERVNLALASLPPEQRDVVVLHLYADLTFERIATLLAVPPNTVASRYRYAREKLSGLLHDES
jgi:RNA polymerase sigma-70 factor (ECF subfamily)